MNNSFEKETLARISYYKKLFGLALHEIRFRYDKTNTEPMEILPSYPYSGAVVSYNDFAVESWTNKTKMTSVDFLEWEYFIVHELAHVLVSPLDVKARRRYATETEIDDAEETVVDSFTMILLNLIKK